MVAELFTIEEPDSWDFVLLLFVEFMVLFWYNFICFQVKVSTVCDVPKAEPRVFLLSLTAQNLLLLGIGNRMWNLSSGWVFSSTKAVVFTVHCRWIVCQQEYSRCHFYPSKCYCCCRKLHVWKTSDGHQQKTMEIIEKEWKWYKCTTMWAACPKLPWSVTPWTRPCYPSIVRSSCTVAIDRSYLTGFRT